MKYARLLTAIMNQPWAMQPDKLLAMLDIVRFACEGGRRTEEEITARLDAAKMRPSQDRAVAGKQGAIVVIPIMGLISPRAAMVEDISTGGGTSIDRFSAAFRKAIGDDNVKAIIFDIDSPGGNAQGVPEAAAEIRAARGRKPMISQVSYMAASGAYWLAAQADEIVISPSGYAGSIGVYSLHEDISKMLEQKGVKETFISAGKFKVEGHSFEPLSEEARDAMQARVDLVYKMFVDDLAIARGVTSKAIRDGYGQGRVLLGQAAVDEGLADRVGTMAETLNRWGIDVGAPSQKTQAEAETPRLNIARRHLDLIES